MCMSGRILRNMGSSKLSIFVCLLLVLVLGGSAQFVHRLSVPPWARFVHAPTFYTEVVTPPPTTTTTTTTQAPAPINLQEMFSDVFNWNKDLVNDTRFGNCPPPNVSDISDLSPQGGFFFGLSPRHRMASMMIRRLIAGEDSLQKRICTAGILRNLQGINPNAWLRGVFGAHSSNPELFNLDAPPAVEVVPSLFLQREVLEEARRQGSLPQNRRACTVVDGRVGSDNGVENLLWYFREDVGVNAFHLSWHLLYPINPGRKADRQGELFYFSHHAHLARYHAERLSNGLPPTEPLFLTYQTPLEEGYNSHLDDSNSGQSWTPRSANRVVQDTLFDNLPGLPQFISVANQTTLISRVQEAILSGVIPLPGRGNLLLDSRTGIDFLGDLIEATSASVNPAVFGAFGFHNEGHVLIGMVEDPGNVTRVGPGVMAEVATAMRDPLFYRYHTTVDAVFDLHKQLLQPYAPEGGELQLKWKGMEVQSVEAVEEGSSGTANHLSTFYSQRTFELSRGLDFQGSGVDGNVGACVTQLDHTPFTYRILVNHNRKRSANVLSTVRIFMAPRFNERGERYRIVDQRKHFFMMDLFQVTLQPGLNMIMRGSSESSLTLSNNHCGCGWPHNMLLPRGTEAGMAFDLFVMLTNANRDAVSSTNPNVNANPTGACSPAPIYCGRMNDTYPDARPMNYPFDRLPYSVNEVQPSADPTHHLAAATTRYVIDLEEYVSHVPNMGSAQVVVRHTAQIRSRPSRTQPQTNPPAEADRLQNLIRSAPPPSSSSPLTPRTAASSYSSFSQPPPQAALRTPEAQSSQVPPNFLQFDNQNSNSSYTFFFRHFAAPRGQSVFGN